MRKYVQTTLLLAVFVAVPAFASTATDFYLELLRRGTAEVEAGRHDSAITPLRLAAFGLVDSIEHYQTAQAYLAVAFDRLGQQEEARRAASRIVTAEGIERKFLSLPLPAAIRTAFAAVARKVLSPPDAGMLTAPVSQTSTAPRQNPAPVVPQPQPQSQPQRPPQTTTIAVPMPQEPAPQRQTPRNDPPKAVEPPKPAPQTQTPVQTPPRTDPPKTTTTTTTTPPVQTQVAPKPQPVQPQPQPARVDVPSRLAAADRALNAANLTEARRIYREVLAVETLDRATLIRVGEGLYRARDFAPALTAFRRLGALRTGEEAYRYYIAVALYETGDFAAAKRELAAALPFIELTPDVQRYRAKIEGAR